MALSDDQLRQAVDEVLDPVWADEKRERRRLIRSTLARVFNAMLILWLFGLLVHWVVGVTIPWVAFAFVTVLVSCCAFYEAVHGSHSTRA